MQKIICKSDKKTKVQACLHNDFSEEKNYNPMKPCEQQWRKMEEMNFT